MSRYCGLPGLFKPPISTKTCRECPADVACSRFAIVDRGRAGIHSKVYQKSGCDLEGVVRPLYLYWLGLHQVTRGAGYPGMVGHPRPENRRLVTTVDRLFCTNEGLIRFRREMVRGLRKHVRKDLGNKGTYRRIASAILTVQIHDLLQGFTRYNKYPA